MNRKVIELSEYQTKTPSSDDLVFEEDTRHDEDKVLQDLILQPEDKKLQSYLRKKNILTIRQLLNGLEISSTSHIGVVQFSGFTIKVLPKFSLSPTSLPKMIAYAFDLDDIILPTSEIEVEPDEKYLIDILIAFFVRKCQKLLRLGLMKSYVSYQDDIKFLRGKLLLQNQIYHNINHKPVFSCEFDELEYNNLDNQILLYTLRQSYRLTKSDSLRKEDRLLIHQFSSRVDDVSISLEDFDKINYSRTNKHYEPIHGLCKLIISATGISDFYHDKKHLVSSFFVDMNMIFEKFVTRLFKEYYLQEYMVEEQKGKRAWVTDGGGSSLIRTDILLTSPEGKKIVVDTKYKRKLSSNDPPQIFLYVHEYKQKKGYAVLPYYADSSDQRMTTVVSEVTIEIKRIDLENTLDLLYSEKPKKSELQELVKKLVPPIQN